MAELIVAGFKDDLHRAYDLLSMLQDLEESWAVDLRDAIALYRDRSGALRMDHGYPMTTGDLASWGGLFGSLIVAVLAVPLTGGASAAAIVAGGSAAGAAIGATADPIDAKDWNKAVGVPNDFGPETTALIQPGDSAIFALARRDEAEGLIAEIRSYGGAILRTTLNAGQRVRFAATLRER